MMTLHVIFSFKYKLDIIAAHNGDDELRGAALATPISCILNKNTIPPMVIPRIPDSSNRLRFSLLSLDSPGRNMEKINKKINKRGKRIVFA
jgi:hypothetical protein